MENNTEKKFVDGLFVKLPNDKAPDFVLLDMSVNNKFMAWAMDNMDEKGWVNIQIKRSKNGSIYGELNSWKPKAQSEEGKEYNENKYKVTPSSELEGLDKINQKDAENMFGSGMTDEELESLSNIPF